MAAVTDEWRCACGQIDLSGLGLGVVHEIEIGFEMHRRLGCFDAGEPMFAAGEEN